jgi:hypothetical protein
MQNLGTGLNQRMLGCSVDLAFRAGNTSVFGSPYLDYGSYVDHYQQTIIGQTLSRTNLLANAASDAVGISLCMCLDTGYYVSYFRPGYLWVTEAYNLKYSTYALDGHNTTNGGTRLLPYKSSSPFKMLLLVKKGDSTLHYSVVTPSFGSAPTIGGFTAIGVTLASGFETFCATSEVQNISDPERIHLVYIKSTGELCYRKFENDAWSGETVLVASGASYPVIAAGEGGRLYVFHVKDGKIWFIKYDGANWRDPIEFWTDQHTYNNPAYLSTNQNVQGGKICLVWTEGTASPYQVWFSYIEDA